MTEPEDHRLWDDYCEDWAFEMADLQNDTPEYRRAHYRPFPSFDDWLVQRVVSDVENAYYDAAHEVMAE